MSHDIAPSADSPSFSPPPGASTVSISHFTSEIGEGTIEPPDPGEEVDDSASVTTVLRENKSNDTDSCEDLQDITVNAVEVDIGPDVPN